MIKFYDTIKQLVDRINCQLEIVAVIFDSDGSPLGYKNEFKPLTINYTIDNPIGMLTGLSPELLDVKDSLVDTSEIDKNIVYINSCKLMIVGSYFEDDRQLYLCEILDV